jgi:hypothetical protein
MKTALLREFHASRIFAQGWNAARENSLDIQLAAPNPYPPGPEHARWNEGFAQAQAR